MSRVPLTRRRRSIGAALSIATVLSLAVVAPAAADVSDTPGRTWATNGRVYVIESVGGKVYVGGDFTAVIDTNGTSHPAGNVAVFDPVAGTFDTTWGAGTNGTVFAIAISGNTAYLGGDFSQVDGANRRKLGAVNLTTGALVTTWHPTVDGQVQTVVVQSGKLYAGGVFLNVTDASGTYAQPRLARFDATTGAFDPSWRPTPNDRVRRIMPNADGTRMYVGGDFTDVSGASGSVSLVSIVTATGAVDPQFKEGPNNSQWRAPVFDLATDDTHLLVAAAGSGGGCALQDPVKGTTIWSHHSNGNMQAVEIIGSIAYCGGHFSGSGSFELLDRMKLAAVDLTSGTVLPYAPKVNSALGIWSMASDATHLYIGGDFTKINGVDQAHFARFSQAGTESAPLQPRQLSGMPGSSIAYLTWLPPTADGGSIVKSYRIYRQQGTSTPKAVGHSSSLAFTDTTAANNTTYSYTVAAVNAIGEGPRSTPVQVTPKLGVVTAPGAPNNLSASTLPGAVQLSWSPPTVTGGAPVTGYQLLRGTSTGAETLLTTLGLVTSYTDTSVAVQQRYFYTVKAVNLIGPGLASDEAQGVPNSGVPSNPVITGFATSGTVTLTWPLPNSNGSPLTKFTLVRDAIRLAVLTPTTTTYVDKGLTHGQTYRYQLKAANTVGSSKYSNTVLITVP